MRPGGRLAIPIAYNPGRTSQPQSAAFTFETNFGVLRVMAGFHPLPEHQIEPESISHEIYEGDEEWSFDLTHWRAVKSADTSPTRVIALPDLELEQLSTHVGALIGMPGITREDISYRVRLKSGAIGPHKSAISVVDAQGRELTSASVIWRRLPFQSTVPDRVTIGQAPIRVFLRCRDDSVELAYVVSVPDGVRATITSPRQLTVQLMAGYAGPVNGAIEVETSAMGRNPLKMPVVRYVATAS